jgi:hypothetical protein
LGQFEGAFGQLEKKLKLTWKFSNGHLELPIWQCELTIIKVNWAF